MATILLAFGVYYVFSFHRDENSREISQQDTYCGERLDLSKFVIYWSIVIPCGWEIEKAIYEKEGLIFSDKLIYSKEIGKVLFADNISNSDIVRFSVSEILPEDGPGNLEEYVNYSKEAVSFNGYPGDLYSYTFKAGETIGNYKMVGGEKEQTYFLIMNDSAIEVSYYILDGDDDMSKFIENVIGSIRFN